MQFCNATQSKTVERPRQQVDMGGAVSVDQVPDRCTKEDCQALYSDLFSDFEWEKHAIDDTMTREALLKAFADMTDVFLTHDWGTDGSTHRKVIGINQLLQARGITTWFDEEKMEGNVKRQMTNGIDNARVIVVFVTQRYIDKVGGTNAEDNCQLEFNYAARRKTASRMIPVLIDPSPKLKNPATWTGEVGLVLGGHLYLDLSAAFDDNQLMAARIDELVAKIVGIAGTPIAQRRFGGSVNESTGVPSASIKPSDASTTIASASAVDTVPMASLTKEQVATMLTALACSKYSPIFLENEITGDVLLGISEVNDVKEMGVTLAAKARMLYDKIAQFKATGVPASLVESNLTPDPEPTTTLRPQDHATSHPSEPSTAIAPTVNVPRTGPWRTFLPTNELLFDPTDVVSFALVANSSPHAELTIQNQSRDDHVAFKIKTTCPTRYTVRPSLGTIDPKCAISVLVKLQQEDCDQLLGLGAEERETYSDKFLVQAVGVEAAFCDVKKESRDDVTALINQTAKKTHVRVKKLNCRFTTG
ncbi:Aste57867_10009 [Aphanomyces stellatus]|uniref:Aste57867_10009 protein n=1 Tax=Aphanomyces stellatus TaxID=120398 RepID=A0A485KPA0_9STRA|nr:hypothetical protein As57867_009970 [Aphanomyces stellatus]VFT86887.1 Aste57867_10009 [Aphanomyces stellatus]